MEKQSWLLVLGRALKPAGLKVLIAIFCMVFGSYGLSKRVGTFEEEFASVSAAAKGCEIGSPEDRAICAAYDPYAARAVERYPNQAEIVYRYFGGTDELRSVDQVCRGDLGVIPLVAYFVENDQLLLEATDKLGKAVAETWTAMTEGRQPNFSGAQFQKLSPEERGWAILQMALKNCDVVLSQFVIKDDGNVKRLAGRTTFAVTSEILAGGLMTLEQKSASGLPIDREDWKEAAIDIVSLPLLMTGGSATIKTLRLAREGKVVSKGVRVGFVTRTALLPAKFVTKTGGKLALIGGVAYLAATHPIIVARFLLATIGELIAIFGWWVLVFVTAFLWWIFGPLWRIARFVFRMVRGKTPPQ